MTTALLPPDGDYPAVAGGYYSTFQWSIYQYKVKFPEGVRGVNIPDRIRVVGGTFTSQVLGDKGHLGEGASESSYDFARRLLQTKASSVRTQYIEDRQKLLRGEDSSQPEIEHLAEMVDLTELAELKSLDRQDIFLHRLLANYHLAKIEEINQFLQRKRGP